MTRHGIIALPPTDTSSGPSMLVVSDLHLHTEMLRWVLERSEGVDVVIIAGDLLDAAGGQPTAAQVATARAFLAALRQRCTVVVCSGNHDLDGIDDAGERAAGWNAELAEFATVDGELLDLGDTVISVCPWWDGPAGADRLRARLDAHADLVGLRRWIWVHHAPAAGSRTAWDGRRDCGDVVLSELVDLHRPSVVLSGHVHQAPFVEGGDWHDERGATVLLNAGQQRGPEPAHLIVDLAEASVTWTSSQAGDHRSLDPTPALVLAAA